MMNVLVRRGLLHGVLLALTASLLLSVPMNAVEAGRSQPQGYWTHKGFTFDDEATFKGAVTVDNTLTVGSTYQQTAGWWRHETPTPTHMVKQNGYLMFYGGVWNTGAVVAMDRFGADELGIWVDEWDDAQETTTRRGFTILDDPQDGWTARFQSCKLGHTSDDLTVADNLIVEGTVTSSKSIRATGGSDVAELFPVGPNTEVLRGYVCSISADRAVKGSLEVSNTSYDRRVAGIISGANGLNPGMVLSQEGTIADGEYPVALSGRVYAWCDASYGAIAPGDLLTTSATPGHAMKVTDYERAQGATIGKAMTSLPEGEKGLVLVLVNLH